MKFIQLACNFLILFSLLLLQFCASGNIWLYVNENGSGRVQMVKKEIQARQKIDLEFLKGSPSELTEMKISSVDSNFSSIHTLKMNGASFIYYPQEVNSEIYNCLLFTLDTSAESEWFRYFQITNVKMELFDKEAKSRDDLARFNNLAEYFVWEIHLAGDVKTVKDFQALGPEWWISKHSNSKVVLKIPAKDILNSRRKFSTYEVCSSPK